MLIKNMCVGSQVISKTPPGNCSWTRAHCREQSKFRLFYVFPLNLKLYPSGIISYHVILVEKIYFQMSWNWLHKSAFRRYHVHNFQFIRNSWIRCCLIPTLGLRPTGLNVTISFWWINIVPECWQRLEKRFEKGCEKLFQVYITYLRN